MKKIGFLLMLFFAVVQATSGQTIEYRNNCLDSCNIQSNTVFELKTNTPFPNGTTFAWTIDGRAYPTQTNKSSVVHQFDRKGTYTASVSIQEPGLPVNVKTKTVYIGAIMNGSKFGFMINGVVGDTLIELCTGTPPPTRQLAVPSPFSSSTHTFRWFPNGETTQSITVDKEGCYSVKVFETGDPSGCFYEAHSKVKICGSYPNMPPSTSGSSGSGTAAAVPECVNCPQWDLGNNVKVIFPTDGRPPYSENIPSTTPFNAPANVAHISIYNRGANYQIGGLNSNGRAIIDNQNNLLGSITKGDITLSNGVAFIPKNKCKGCNSIYYLISTAIEGSHKKLYFHTIDLSLNSGRGGLINSEGYLSNIPVSEKISVVKTTNGYQLLSLDEKGENLLSFSVDEKGISEPTTTALNAPAGGNTMGNMNLSVDNSKLAIALPPNKIKILNTSPISNFADLTVSSGEVNGVSFSPDGNLLYVSVNNLTGSSVHQFKLDTSNIQASNKYVMLSVGKLGAIQLDPARRAKLYITREGSNHFFTIDRPNTRIYNSSTATSAGVSEFSSLLAAGNLGLGLPLAISESSPDSPPSISMECKGTTYSFKMDKDLCEKNKNKKVIWELWYAGLNPNTVINPILNLITGQKEVYPGASLIYSTTTNSTGSGGSVNNISYDFKINTSSPNPDGYYVLVAKISNDCVTDYLMDAQAFFVRNLRPVNVTKQFDIINNLSCPISPITINAFTGTGTIPSNSKTVKYFQVPSFANYAWIKEDRILVVNNPLIVQNPAGEGAYEILVLDPETQCSVKEESKVVFYNDSKLPAVDYWDICMDVPFPQKQLTVLPNAVNLTYAWNVIAPAPPDIKLGKIISPIPSNQNFITIDRDGKYRVQITDDAGCQLIRNFVVDNKCLPEAVAPTVYNPRKPSSDGSVPRFYPLYNWPVKDFIGKEMIPGSSPSRYYEKNRVKTLSFKVFNRWGQLVFGRDFSETDLKDPNFDIKQNGWDGTYNGNMVPQDTYAWIIEFESADFPNLGKQSKTGSVLVVY